MTTALISKFRFYGIAIMVAAILLGFAGLVHANPFYTGTKAQTAVATSTFASINPGLGTTTLLYDSYEQNGTNQTNSGNVTIPVTVALAIQGVASSSGTQVNIACEFSDDNKDWYQNGIFPATTTNPASATIANSFSFNYSTSTATVGGSNLSTTNRYAKLVTCPVPLRYVRAVISDTGSSTELWATIIPTKQRN